MAAAAPPGIDPREFLRAITEDTCDLLSNLEGVRLALATPIPGLDDLTWPGTHVIDAASASAAFDALAGLATAPGAEAAVITADAPDLPPLLIAKLFRALGRAKVAYAPADGGGLVALAARLPLPGWAAGIDPDAPAAGVRLRKAAPDRPDVAKTPGWHRLRTPADLHHLDPALEGWDATRALLSGHPLPR
ncbi:hypothetical protein D5H75_12160 [Bailinhaonella thermotolerans]|uniref:MobA-like NTP transferase domain-containing protein n=2 Tax=Bailinhaonella thermotolerans TaxID=1070861 RepID=A0A3A4B849_9ACTN|nr:hypothetical protein D5H75_12160 [Bailinhaonella thermotolerans]